MKRLLRLIVLVAAVAAGVAVVRARQRGTDPLPRPATSPSAPWPPLRPEPAADAVEPRPEPEPAPEPAAEAEPGAPWADPTDDGECPDGFPIKAKLSSKIFHAPGQLNYDRTTPDRCYVDAGAAEADGLRAAKR